MIFLPVPKLLRWTVPSIPQQYTSKKSILLVSGCSFTASTLQTEFAASWPGFVLDRCGFDHCIDYSYPGVGNEYIGDSILHHLACVPNSDDYMVIVMWSGLDRIAVKSSGTAQPNLNGTMYSRGAKDHVAGTAISKSKIFEVKEYLESRHIPYVFTIYANLLFPPYIPKRDNSPEFKDDTLKQIDWIPNQPMDFLYEFGFKNSLLSDDLFHPTNQCVDLWTNEVLLPQMCVRNLIENL